LALFRQFCLRPSTPTRVSPIPPLKSPLQELRSNSPVPPLLSSKKPRSGDHRESTSSLCHPADGGLLPAVAGPQAV
jgi:hypothetical protein